MTGRTFEDLMVALVPLLVHRRTPGGALLGGADAVDGADHLDRLDALALATTGLLDREHVAVVLEVGGEPAGDGAHGRPGAIGVVGASSGTARRAHEVQLSHGEGPSLEAWRGAVHVEDLADEARWPLTTPALVRLGVTGLEATALRAGGRALGSLTTYRTGPDGASGPHTLEDVAEAMAHALLRSGPLAPTPRAAPAPVDPRDDATAPGDVEVDPFAWLLSEGLGLSAAFHQACGMVAVQVGCDVDEARLRLRARAFAEDRAPLELARAIVARRERLER